MKTNTERMYYSLSLIEQYEQNWNGYGADPFPADLLQMCEAFAEQFPFSFEVYPTGRNSIQFEWETAKGAYIEFEIFSTHISCYLLLNNGEEEESTINIHDLKKIAHLIKRYTHEQFAC